MGPVNRPLDLEWLEDFMALSECGNFSRAAQARNIAQPAFSRHIRSLEEWTGVELIDRTRHPAVPTPAGDVMLSTARDLVLRLSLARTQAHEAQDRTGRSLRFAATHVLSLAFFPGWLQRVEQRLPTQLGPIHMVSDSFKVCEELMLHRRVQFLLSYGHPAVPTRLLDPDFEYRRVGADLLVPVCAPSFAGAGADLHDATEPLPILVYSEESWLGQIMRSEMRWVYDARRFKPVVTSHHTGLIKNMTLAGRGLAWLPSSLVQGELDDSRLVAADDLIAVRETQGNANRKRPCRMPLEIHLFHATAPSTPLAEALWQQIDESTGIDGA